MIVIIAKYLFHVALVVLLIGVLRYGKAEKG